MEMFWMELAVLVIAIAIGARWGGLGLGAAGGIGLAVMVFVFGLKPGAPPISVLMIMTAVVACCSVLQGSGGLDFLVNVASKLLRKHPKYITIIAPFLCYCFTLFCGTAYVAFALYPVIAEVAAGAMVRPERAMSMSVIGAQAAIVGSPMSAATAAMIGLLAVSGVTPFQIFMITIPAGLLAVGVGCALMYKWGKELADDPEFQRRVQTGEFKPSTATIPDQKFPPNAKRAVAVFAVGLALVVFYGASPELLPSWTAESGKVTRLSIPHMVQILMLMVAGFIMVIANVEPKKLSTGSVFQAGLTGMVAVFGISWLTDTFFTAYKPLFIDVFGETLSSMPALFAFILFALSAVLFSQGATVTALMPLGLALGIAPTDTLWMFPAVNGYFFIPAGGAIIACIAFDRTGTMKIGKYVLNHSYMIPGLVVTFAQCLFAFVISRFVL